MVVPTASEHGAPAFDHSKPFAGVVVCCTSIPPDQRTEIANRASDMGGSHMYDLTPAVTHLIVGEYETPKYRHVAKERPDIKPMASGWIDAVRALWMEDKEFDFAELESRWRLRTFETSGGQEVEDRGRLICCLTGFEDAERQYIETTVKANGGCYTGDLSKKVTHLVVCKPEGKKYQAAKNWGVKTVSIEWLKDSVKRGMILDEECYDPVLPVEERGKGAIVDKTHRRVSLGKRSRDGSTSASTVVADDGRRKLRKTASMKFSDQTENIWGDILVRKPSMDLSRPGLEHRAATVANVTPITPSSASTGQAAPNPIEDHTQMDGPVFESCRFFVNGFPPQREKVAQDHLLSHGGQISSSLSDVAAASHPGPTDKRFLLVPQNSQPATHPTVPAGVHIVTEFYIERCIHSRYLPHPNDHVLGRPFPKFPIDGFDRLTICTAGFRDEQLNQIEKTITQLGAVYSERLNNKSSVLVCPSMESVRKQKLDFALFSKVPVVKADWLWQCISTGFLIPWEKFLFQELRQKISIDVDPELEKERQKLQRTRSEPVTKKQKTDFRAPAPKVAVDKTAFEKEKQPVARPQQNSVVQEQESNEFYDTALTHQNDSLDTGPAPLLEVSANALNKPPSPSKTEQPPRKTLRRFPTGASIGDSEAGDELDAPVNEAEKEASAEVADAERRRQAEEEKRQAEEEKRQAEQEQRQALSNRLTSLLDGEAGGQESPDSSTNRPQRRKRGLIGRATSNVSATSSTSGGGDSSHSKPIITTSLTGGLGMEGIKNAPPGALGTLDKLLSGQDTAVPTEDSASQQAPSTQIGYDDPRARSARKALLDHMTGKNQSSGGQRSQEGASAAVTMRTLEEQGVGTTQTRKSRRR